MKFKPESRFVIGQLILILGMLFTAFVSDAGTNTLVISDYGAVGDGVTVNTATIQSTINQCAALGGGTIIVPPGVFVTGAITLVPGVNLQVQAGGVLKGSTNQWDYPIINGRIEGQIRPNPMALINATNNDNLTITGPGILDGSGPAQHAIVFTNTLGTNLTTVSAYPQLAAFQDCSNLFIGGITFSNTSFWNCHLYRCNDSTIQNVRFIVTSSVPSSDGTDIDSCSNVVVNGCYYQVYDDCIALKGSRGSNALADVSSPPVGHILITNCTFAAGQGGVTCGTEGTLIHDVHVESCTNLGNMPAIRLKMRIDTPGQDYEDLHYNNLTMGSAAGRIIDIELNHGTKVPAQPPRAIIRNIYISNIHGFYGEMGDVSNNTNTDIGNIFFSDYNVRVTNVIQKTAGATNVIFRNVFVNVVPWTGSSSTAWSTAGNWNASVTGITSPPSNGVSAMFNSFFVNQPTLTTAATAQSLCVADGVSQDVTINAASAQTLGLMGNATENNVTNTGVLMTDTNNHSLTIGANVGIVLSNNTSFFNQENSGTLTIAGSLNNNGKILAIAGVGTGDTVISGLISGTGSITLNTSNTVTFSNASSSYSGALNVLSGTLRIDQISTEGNVGELGKGVCTLGGSGTIGTLEYTAAVGQSKSRKLTMGIGGAGNFQIDNPITLELLGVVSGSGGLIRSGGSSAGVLRLSATNTYTGPTTVLNGTLALGPNGSISNSPFISIGAGATFDVSARSDGTLTLNTGKTLAGGGAINGRLIAAAGSTIAPGPAISTLTVTNDVVLGGTLVLKLNRNDSLRNDRLATVAGAMTYGGTLLVTNTGSALRSGDTFQLFAGAATNANGSTFSVINLATNDAAGNRYTWLNKLTVDGSAQVLTVNGVNTTPTNLTCQIVNGALNLSWPADHQGWRLQIQTNDLAAGLSPNWSTVPNSTNVNSMSIPVALTNGCVFLRLIYP